MRIDRSWGLCVLITIALVSGPREVKAQSYPAAGGHQQMAPPMQSGMPPGMGPMSMPEHAPGPGGQPGTPAYPPMAALPPGANAGPPPAQGGMMRDSRAAGQPMMPPGAGPMGAPPPSHGPQPAGYYDPAQGAPPQQPGPSPAAPIDGMGPAECPDMGHAQYPPGAGYDDPAFHDPAFYPDGAYASDDFDWSNLQWLLPYGAGGYGTPRWYDASAEWVSLKRDSVGDNTVFSTLGREGDPVLGTDQLDFDNESAFRATFAIQLGPGSSLETTYLGLANWASNSEVTSDQNELYSIYSEFGTDPPGGFAETDQASFHGIAYSSDFDTIELNYRRRWAGPNVRLQGSWFYGLRYMQLKEDFQYITQADGSSETLVSTLNSLTGAQLGSSLWLCLYPGLQVGTEARAGLFGNHATQRTTISVSNPAIEPYQADVTEDGAAFLADATITALWRINQQWTLRGGYMFLWMDEVALATDNFDPDTPIFGSDPPRDPVIDNNSYVFYHGFTAGVEYLW